MRAVQAAILFLYMANVANAGDSKFAPNDHVCDGVSAVTYQILQCVDNALTQSDRALNQIYTLLMKELAAGAIPNSSAVFFKEKKTDLLRAEWAWTTFKEAQCRVEGELLAPGTGVPVETENCALLLTNERIRFLLRYEKQIRSDSNLCQPDASKCALPDEAP